MLREATEADIPIIQSVLNAPENLDRLAGYADAQLQAALHSPDSWIGIWQDGPTAAAFIWLTGMGAGTSPKVEEFGAVTPGRGYGTRLFQAVLDRLVAAGTPRLWLAVAADNADAIRLYQRLGFVAEEVRPKVWARRAGPVADTLVMGLALGPADGG